VRDKADRKLDGARQALTLHAEIGPKDVGESGGGYRPDGEHADNRKGCLWEKRHRTTSIAQAARVVSSGRATN
jgi:hypothetical protein